MGPLPSDARAPLLEALHRHRTSVAFTADEAESLDRLVAFVRTVPSCFERAERRGHVTGSAWVVDADDARAILLHHRKLGIWLQPGGHADGVADVAQVALEEAREETGIQGLVLASPGVFDVDVHAIPARPGPGGDGAHFHFDVRYLFRAPAGAQPVVSEESHAVRWMTPEEVTRYASDRSVRRMLDKWTRGVVPPGA